MAEDQDSTESIAVEVEEWRDVPGYEGLYQVSSLGRVYSLKKAAGLNGSLADGYPVVSLCRDGRSRGYKVHRLVLLAFVGPPESGQEACHHDGNRGNPRLENLRWDSHYENCRDSVRHRRERGPVAKTAPSPERIESMARARAARFGRAAIDEMTVTELELRASTATTLKAKARWLRKIVARGIDLNPKQREILALAFRSSSS